MNHKSKIKIINEEIGRQNIIVKNNEPDLVYCRLYAVEVCMEKYHQSRINDIFDLIENLCNDTIRAMEATGIESEKQKALGICVLKTQLLNLKNGGFLKSSGEFIQ